jgi:hypothetical protein
MTFDARMSLFFKTFGRDTTLTPTLSQRALVSTLDR